MEVDSWLTGRRGAGLPFTDECEPLCSDSETFQKLFQSALKLGRDRGWKYLECRGGEEFLPDAPASLVHYTHCIDLQADERVLFARLDGGVRQAIRKAGKAGVQVEISRELAAVEVFYSLLVKTRKRHGMPPQPFSLFRNIFQQVLRQNMGVVIVARKGHTPVGAAVYFKWGNRAIYKYGASDERFQHLRGNNLVMWEAIKWCAREGMGSLHLGRTSLANAGLRKFKLGWGAEEGKIAYYKFDLRRQQFVVERDETEGWHNRIFRSAPEFASRLAGRLLYRHWA
jgi:lipid II:glycine glycyltransferase (peptidoglycan interpeptide bridge formation enzyme)